MKTIPEEMKTYLETHPLDFSSDDCATVLDQLYLAYADSRESDLPEIRDGFADLEVFLKGLPRAITMLFAISVVVFVLHMNERPL